MDASAAKWVLAILAAVAGCERAAPRADLLPPADSSPPQVSSDRGSSAMTSASLQVTSSAFNEGQPIPKRYTGEGEDVSPPLAWSAPPAGTKELAVICSDPDAPAGTWYHWVLFGLPPDTTALPEGLAKDAELADPPARQGRNSWPSDNVGYRGPMPPKGHGPHRYFFTVYALDQPLALSAGEPTAEQVQAAMQGHILAQGQLMGTYERK